MRATSFHVVPSEAKRISMRVEDVGARVPVALNPVEKVAVTVPEASAFT